ncbi:MAG: nucleotidyl transferase AbiEii/AbiGii toxin family protein [Ignavibacteriae bacterium]|nr:nucleotidyl transferase AbiEii/AbiGii toxin family protein [Ignavibacteriota bacterium]
MLELFGANSLIANFYLTGGTALSAFYLQHRYSEDLDFFTSTRENIHLIRQEVLEILRTFAKEVKLIRSLETFIEAHVHCHDGEVIKIDFAFDSPFRFEEPITNVWYNIRVDSLLDIGCNKISTVFDRATAKDFVDLYFLLNEHFRFDELWEKAKQKHVGLDDYWFCQSLIRVKQLQQLPNMIRQVAIEELKTYFLNLHSEMIARISGITK